VQTSPNGLIQFETDAEGWLARSHVIAWTDPLLRTPLIKISVLAASTLLLAGLEYLSLLAPGYPGLFPALLGLGTLFYGLGTEQMRKKVFRLEALAKTLHFWEGPEDQFSAEAWQRIEQSALKNIYLKTLATGRNRSQPVICFETLSAEENLCLGGGLPESELAWLVQAILATQPRLQTP